MLKIYDTLTASHLLDENLPENGLKYLTRTQLHREVTEYKDVIKYGTDSPEFAKYATEDAINTYDLYKLQSPQIEKEGLHKLFYEIEMPFQKALMHLAVNGIKGDVSAAKQMTYDVQHLYYSIENELLEIFGGHYIVGITPRSRVTSCKPSINFNSSDQVVPLIESLGFEIYERSKKTKKKSWNKQSKKRLEGKHYAVDLLIKLGKVQKLLNGFLIPFGGFIDVDGRIRCSFHNTVCVTGRLSCSSPNIEQLPKNNDIANIRNLFVAEPGNTLIVADYSGQEVRIMAQESGDTNLKDRLRKGYDVHLATANEIHKLNIPSLGLTDKTEEHNVAKVEYKKERDDCKSVVFGTAYGKSQPLDAQVITPYGKRKFRNLRVGDKVCTPEGVWTNITHIHPQGIRPVYKVVMKDGSVTECDENHLWTIQTVYDKSKNQYRTLTTKQIKKILKKGKQNNCFIEYPASLDLPPRLLLIDPYIMGVYLGDGSSVGSSINITNTNTKILDTINLRLLNRYYLSPNGKCSWRIVTNKKRNKKGQFESNNTYLIALRHYKLKGKRAWEKFIPSVYLWGGLDQRWDLLRGLLDSDGSKNHNSYEYTTTSKQLSEDVKCLVKSLGGRCSKTERYTKCSNTGKVGRKSYRLFISFPPFAKANSIEAIEYIGKKDCRCITIADDNGLYLTDDFIVTHNSAYGFAKDFGCTEKEAQMFIDKFFSQYPGLKRVIEKTREQVYKHGFVRNMVGRKRRFPDFHKLNKWGKERCYRQAFNFKIQSYGADVIKVAAGLIVLNPNLMLVNIVHDEIVVECQKEYVEEGMKYINKCMVAALPIFLKWDIDMAYAERYGACK